MQYLDLLLKSNIVSRIFSQIANAKRKSQLAIGLEIVADDDDGYGKRVLDDYINDNTVSTLIR